MKLIALFLGACLSTVALGDVVTIDKNGETAVLNGTSKGSAAEVLRIVSQAFEIGYKTSRGADIFTKNVEKEGKYSVISLQSKNIFASRDAHLLVMYQVDLNGKAGDISVRDDVQKIVLKGEVAKTLMGAMRLVIDQRAMPETLGVEQIQTVSGRVRCEKVIVPNAVPTCFLSL